MTNTRLCWVDLYLGENNHREKYAVEKIWTLFYPIFSLGFSEFVQHFLHLKVSQEDKCKKNYPAECKTKSPQDSDLLLEILRVIFPPVCPYQGLWLFHCGGPSPNSLVGIFLLGGLTCSCLNYFDLNHSEFKLSPSILLFLSIFVGKGRGIGQWVKHKKGKTMADHERTWMFRRICYQSHGPFFETFF